MNPVEYFEDEFKRFIGSKHAVAVCNGTAALHTALLSCGVKEGDEVITTPFTFVATGNAILMCGATPVFADIEEETYCINPAEVEAKLEEHPDAVGVLAVHLFGNMADIKTIRRLLGKDQFLVEDSSQALGATRDGKMVGILGDAGTFSFYASKNLWTFEGGMVVTDSDYIYRRAMQIRNHGLENGEMVRMGYNYKMPWNCAFLGWQMLKLHKPAILAELGRYGLKDGYYPKVVYQHPYYVERGITGDCPVAEDIAWRVKHRK